MRWRRRKGNIWQRKRGLQGGGVKGGRGVGTMTVAHNAGRCMGVKASKTRNARLRLNVAGCRHVENAAVTTWICILADSAISALSSSRARTTIFFPFYSREAKIIVCESAFLAAIRSWIFTAWLIYRVKCNVQVDFDGIDGDDKISVEFRTNIVLLQLNDLICITFSLEFRRLSKAFYFSTPLSYYQTLATLPVRNKATIIMPNHDSTRKPRPPKRNENQLIPFGLEIIQRNATGGILRWCFVIGPQCSGGLIVNVMNSGA